MMRAIWLALMAALAAMPAHAQKNQWAPLGCQQLTSLSAATKLTNIPPGATLIAIAVEGQSVRYRDDGVAPTGSVGELLPIGGPWPYSANLSAIQFIQTSASATVDVCFYQ